jgi:hypothetical protein
MTDSDYSSGHDAEEIFCAATRAAEINHENVLSFLQKLILSHICVLIWVS